MSDLDRLQFEELPGPLGGDPDVDGVAWISDGTVKHPIPFGGSVPSGGASEKPYAVWWWDGDREEPTLKPSVDVGDMHIHLRDGEVEEC